MENIFEEMLSIISNAEWSTTTTVESAHNQLRRLEPVLSRMFDYEIDETRRAGIQLFNEVLRNVRALDQLNARANTVQLWSLVEKESIPSGLKAEIKRDLTFDALREATVASGDLQTRILFEILQELRRVQ